MEVLKGPGAILYGIVDPGGVINITSKEPLDTPYYAVSKVRLARGLSHHDRRYRPTQRDKSLLYRMNMSYENNGAPSARSSISPTLKTSFLAPVVKWNPDDATWVKLEAEYSNYARTPTSRFDPVSQRDFRMRPAKHQFRREFPVSTERIFLPRSPGRINFDKDWSIKQQIAYNFIRF